MLALGGWLGEEEGVDGCLLECSFEERDPARDTATSRSQMDHVERVLAECPMALEITDLESQVSWDPRFYED